jgi:predicted Zn-dependent peptidase
MRTSKSIGAAFGFTVLAALLIGCGGPSDDGTGAPTADAPGVDALPAAGLQVDVRYERLDNGLRVVLAPDDAVPTATIAVYYGIGLRIEPQDRTGFAHLFEHMMFEGSTNLPEGGFDDLILGNGGLLNGSTRFDFTNYYEVVPSSQVERILWAEADRMAGLNVNETNLNQQTDVVKNEVRVNVLNQPYGGFPWLDMPQYANVNWYNAHNFYGELADLDAATLEDVRAFFATYYAPNNAVVVVAGDIDAGETLAWVNEHFGDIPRREQMALPDISEPLQEAEKRATKDDPLAPRPALAFAYHVPERNTPEWYAMGLIDAILLQGSDSRLYDAIVREAGHTGDISGGINLLGNMFNYRGPMLWIAALIHDPDSDPAAIMADVDAVIERIRTEPVSQEELDRALVKLRSALYDIASSPTRFGLVDLLACFALFDDDPARINRLEAEFAIVTPELIRQTASQYLRPTNRTVLEIHPAAPAGAGQ